MLRSYVRICTVLCAAMTVVKMMLVDCRHNEMRRLTWRRVEDGRHSVVAVVRAETLHLSAQVGAVAHARHARDAHVLAQVAREVERSGP
jgi:hypothetical protein